MKKIKKSLLSIVALCMVMALSFGAFAAAPAASGNGSITANDGTQAVTITGNVIASVLSVELPTTVSFNMDPTATSINQVASPDITVTNNSAVPVEVSIASAADAGSFLIETGLATASKKATVAIYDKGTTFTTLADIEAKALTATSTNYNVGVASTGLAEKGVEGNSATLNIFGQASAKGWKVTDSFVVTPTLKASVDTNGIGN